MSPPDTTESQQKPLIRVPKLDTEEFSRVLSSIAIVSGAPPKRFYDILDACDELSHASEHSYAVELPALAGPHPYMIPSRLIAMETLTYFGICIKAMPSQDIAVYTLTEPLGIDFISHLGALAASVRETALHRGTEVKAYIQYLMWSRTSKELPMEKRYLQYVQRDLRAILDEIKAELTFYLIDDRDPENWN